MMRRSLTRSLTRSPTPIKYDYDIYKKRSPTFGRRCPVLNRRPRNLVKNDTDNRSKSNVTTPSAAAAATTSSTGTGNRQDQPYSDQSASSSLVNGNINQKAHVTKKSDHEAGKSVVTSRISSSINTVSGTSFKASGGRSISASWDNPSYFQHDNRESQSTGAAGDGKKVSRKRKPRQSPFRWQHDLFEDDRVPSVKVETRTSQRKKEAKMSKKL